MKPKKRINKTVWIALIVVAAIQLLFDPLSSLMRFSESVQARIGLPYARRKWDAQGITHYKFDIRGYVPLVCIIGGSVEVKDGVVVHTGPSTDALTRGEPDLDLGFGSTASLPLCDYRNYTIPIFFDMVEQYSRSITQISFDPTYAGLVANKAQRCILWRPAASNILSTVSHLTSHALTVSRSYSLTLSLSHSLTFSRE